MRKALLALLIIWISGIVGLRAQSVKDVMLDKTGAYIYSQCRDSDMQVAYETAYAELVKKVRSWCVGNGIAAPDGVTDVQAHIHRINGEKLGQHRVFLYVCTANLRNPASAPASDIDVPEESATPEPEPQPAPEPKAIPTARLVPAKDVAESEPQRPHNGSKPIAALTDTRIRQIVSALLECRSDKKIVERLAKEKNAHGISLYGSGPSKYLRYSYIVTMTGGAIHVLSPEDSNLNRTDLATGETVKGPEGSAFYWFLKK